jgi:DNA-directed RNA polymerase subunit RPC12/RpoP
MPTFYGVRCQKCQSPILLEPADELNDLLFYTLPRTPIRCSHCGFRKQYKLSEASFFLRLRLQTTDEGHIW